jgi:SAM-dependent methyltransferase
MSDFKPHDYEGTCTVCGWTGRFVRAHIAIRETYPCGNCRASLRYRVQAEAILEFFGDMKARTIRELAAIPAFARLRIFEPGIIGPFRALFGGLPHYSKSFYWSDLESGEVRDGVVNEDLMALSIPSGTVDLMISSDVFEHIRHPDRGFAESARILRPGGAHIFTVPTHVPIRETTLKRVDVDGPEDVPIVELRYHGNGKGGRSLVYNDFGRDILDRLADAGLKPAIHRHRTAEPIVCEAIAFVAVK